MHDIILLSLLIGLPVAFGIGGALVYRHNAAHVESVVTDLKSAEEKVADAVENK